MAAHDLGPTHLFHVESIRLSDRIVLSLEGELDIAGIESLDGHVGRAAALPADTVLLDLRALTFIDGTGVRAIVKAALAIGDRLLVYPAAPRVHRVFKLVGAESALPFVTPPGPRLIDQPAGESNLDFVRRLWDAYRAGGADAMAELVPGEVEWRPLVGGGRVLRGPDELRRFWASRRVAGAVRVTELRPVGDDVLARCEYSLANGDVKIVWSLYHFSAKVLVRAETYESELEALLHAA